MTVNMDNPSEMLPLCDEEGILTGAATRGECHNGSKLLHPVVHLHVFNSKGELFLQKRPQWKTIQPGRWDTSVGGHVDLGESVAMALEREAREELGLLDYEPRLLMSYVWDSPVERELVFVHTTTFDGDITPSQETDGGAFFPIDELRALIGKGFLTPMFEGELPRLLEALEQEKRAQ